jgi:hypothetical protein
MIRIEVLENAHRAVTSFYAPVILFQHVVFVLAGAVIDVRAEFIGDGFGMAGVSPFGGCARYGRTGSLLTRAD